LLIGVEVPQQPRTHLGTTARSTTDGDCHVP
jgi:hypothetical protein